LLSISTQLHQAFFDAVEEMDRVDRLASMPRKQAMARIGALARRFDMHFFEFSPPAQRRSDNNSMQPKRAATHNL
jgi:hypothetical protein